MMVRMIMMAIVMNVKMMSMMMMMMMLMMKVVVVVILKVLILMKKIEKDIERNADTWTFRQTDRNRYRHGGTYTWMYTQGDCQQLCRGSHYRLFKSCMSDVAANLSINKECHVANHISIFSKKCR